MALLAEIAARAARKTLLGSLLVIAASAAHAEALSLHDALDRALVRNADLRGSAAAAEIAAAQLRTVREFPNPTLGISTSSINTDGRGNGSSLHNEFLQRSYDSIISLSQLFETAGKRRLKQDSAEAGRRAADAAYDDARRLLIQGVTNAYLAALVAREDARILDDSAGAIRREAEVAAARLRTGDISASDRAQIELAAARFALDAESARQAARVAIVALEVLIGATAPEGNLQLADSLASLRPSLPIDPDAGHAVRPDVAVAQAGVAKADADYRVQLRERVPDVTVTAQFEHHPPDQPNTAGLGFSLPLPVWNRNRGSILAARAARTQAEAQLDKVRAQAAADVAVARSALQEAERRDAAYREQLVPKSSEVLRSVTFAYEHGGASLLDLLSAGRNDNDVRQGATHAAADALAARLALAAALNELRVPSSR